MKTKFIILWLTTTTFFSCSTDDSVSNPTNSQTSLIDLEFTNSPIDLQGVQAVFASNISYDQYTDTVFDIFLPESSTPTGLVIFIHGGGFTGGDKGFIYSSNYENEVVNFLSNGIAVATINYRLI